MKTLIEHLDFALTVDSNDRVIRDAALVDDTDAIGDVGASDQVAFRHDQTFFAVIIDDRPLYWGAKVETIDVTALNVEADDRAAAITERAGLSKTDMPIKTILCG